MIGPLLIALLALVAFGTVLPWRRASNATVVRRLRAPLLLLVAAAVVLAALGVRDPFALAAVAAAATLAFVTLREFALGARWTRRASGRSWPAALAALFDRDRGRYGGYVVHLGLAVMAVAVIGSNIYQEHVRRTLAPGQSFEVGRYSVTYEQLRERTGTGNGIESELIASMRVTEGGREVARLEPGLRFFRNFPGQPTAIVAVQTRLREDIYLFVQGFDESGVGEFQAFVNPLMLWLWVGAGLYTVGGLIAFAPVRAPATVQRELPGGGAAQRAEGT